MAARRQSSTGGGGFLQSLKDFDAYAKPLDDFRVKTLAGATVTLFSGILIAFLVMTEFLDWTRSTLEPALQVDKARKEKMEINLNLTFPHVPCYLLSIDVMDVAGEHQNDVHDSIFKTRLDKNGNAINVEKAGLGDASKPVEEAIAKRKDPKYCGDCYGGKKPESGCCNTCEDVQNAYIGMGWSFDNAGEIEQCKEEHWVERIKSQSEEGCSLWGYLKVNKVAGNVHLAPGKSFQQGSMHVHDLQPYLKVEGLNFDHTIHQLSFGQQPAGFRNPLDGVSKKAVDGEGKANPYGMFQYYTKVVSTQFNFRNKTTVYTNQFSVTEHERDTTPKMGSGTMGLPGVFFNFDISPMLVVYTEYKKPFAHFLTDVCAIVGGVFTVAGILDSFIYTAEKTLKKKMELGKAS
ncbi:Endoplasmic reticulum-Golgi intermediate compartment protein 3 [Rhizophlyctis rosea]|uniref:Endoplasmic reticulum-Golgi intermediate compartment protein 3 n=1 Tax=Rhizophlyctis rosea TaxID=64517 RepID=A0AAD5SA11_9FUNG|nr:Endoplasmic reticulum-Golgi intermediate compartment protein 3 [Rhizophlyctis rosea]